MSTGFHHTSVSLEDNAVVVSGELINRSAFAWTAEKGWAAGYHLFDDPTGTLVIDGERIPLNLEPGGRQRFGMTIAAPAEPGEYAIFVSAMRENEAWFYERGWPFLMIDLSVGENGATILRGWRISDRRSVSLRRAIRGSGRAFTLPLQSIWRNRALIRTLVRRDVLSRYSGSFGGALSAISIRCF